jgi:hypothetical protein
MRTLLIWIIAWLILVAIAYSIPAKAQEVYHPNPHTIMADMLDSYSYMSYAEHVEPFDFHTWSGYERQWSLSCELLDMMTKTDLSDEMCRKIFLYYRWLDE